MTEDNRTGDALSSPSSTESLRPEDAAPTKESDADEPRVRIIEGTASGAPSPAEQSRLQPADAAAAEQKKDEGTSAGPKARRSLSRARSAAAGRPASSAGLRRRILTASGRRRSRVVDQKTDVPSVKAVNRQLSTDYSRAYITREFSIGSNQVQLFFEHSYDRTDYALQVLSAVIPVLATDEFADAILSELDALFRDFSESLDKAIKSTQSMLAKRHLNERTARSAYDHPRTYETPVRSPYSLRFLNLISKYDSLTSYVDSLWLNGYMPSRMQNQTASLWETRFRRFATDLNNLRIRALQDAAAESNKRVRAGVAAAAEEARRVVDERIQHHLGADGAPAAKAADDHSNSAQPSKSEAESAPEQTPPESVSQPQAEHDAPAEAKEATKAEQPLEAPETTKAPQQQ